MWKGAWEVSLSPLLIQHAPLEQISLLNRLGYYVSLCVLFLVLYRLLCGWVLELPLYFQEVSQVLIGPGHIVNGVVLKDGTEVHSKVVLSNATPYVTFKRLTPQVIGKSKYW